MATYLELYGLRNDADLRNKTTLATIISAEGYLAQDSPAPSEASWANAVIQNPDAVGKAVLNAVLADQKDQAAEDIKNVSDANLQSGVDKVVPGIIIGYGV